MQLDILLACFAPLKVTLPSIEALLLKVMVALIRFSLTPVLTSAVTTGLNEETDNTKMTLISALGMGMA